MNLSARAPTPSFATAMSNTAANTNTSNIKACAVQAAAHTVVNTAFISVSSPTSKTTTNSSNNKAPSAAAPLRLQLLEETLANVSMVEAPTSFSPSNISMLSNFSQVCSLELYCWSVCAALEFVMYFINDKKSVQIYGIFCCNFS